MEKGFISGVLQCLRWMSANDVQKRLLSISTALDDTAQHNAINPMLSNVGPPSATLDQH